MIKEQQEGSREIRVAITLEQDALMNMLSISVAIFRELKALGDLHDQRMVIS